jgi:hypothetical protein
LRERKPVDAIAEKCTKMSSLPSFRRDESKALGVVEPLYGAAAHIQPRLLIGRSATASGMTSVTCAARLCTSVFGLTTGPRPSPREGCQQLAAGSPWPPRRSPGPRPG